ncbi:MAG: hypothetical protein Q9163_006035 [Psora crenata]
MSSQDALLESAALERVDADDVKDLAASQVQRSGPEAGREGPVAIAEKVFHTHSPQSILEFPDTDRVLSGRIAAYTYMQVPGLHGKLCLASSRTIPGFAIDTCIKQGGDHQDRRRSFIPSVSKFYSDWLGQSAVCNTFLTSDFPGIAKPDRKNVVLNQRHGRTIITLGVKREWLLLNPPPDRETEGRTKRLEQMGKF